MYTPDRHLQLRLFEYQDAYSQLGGPLVDLARSRIGWPYKRHDHTKRHTHDPQTKRRLGVDCSGFLLGLLSNLGYQPRTVRIKDEIVKVRHVEEMLACLASRARLDIPFQGDLLFVMSRQNGNQPMYHCGIYDGYGRVIHASFGHRAVIQEPFDTFIINRPMIHGVAYKIGHLPDILERVVEKR